DPRAVRSLQGAGHFHAESKYLIRWQGAEFVDPCVQRTGAVILHDQIRITALSFADVQHSDNVRVTGEHAHGALLPDETFPVLVQFSGEHLDRDLATQRRLSAPKDDSEPATTDLFGVVEPGSAQLRDDGRARVALRLERIAVHHRLPAMRRA